MCTFYVVCMCVCCGVQHRFRRLCNSYCLKLDFVTQPTCLHPPPPPPLAHLLTFTMAKKTNGTELPKPLCLFIGLIENVVQSELNRFPNWFPSIDMFIGGKGVQFKGVLWARGCFILKAELHLCYALIRARQLQVNLMCEEVL